MEYSTYVINPGTPDALTTEVMFNIATERAADQKLIKFDIAPTHNDEAVKKTLLAVSKILKKLKKQGRIELFATPDDFIQSTTEAKYVHNKYPELDTNTDNSVSIIIVI